MTSEEAEWVRANAWTKAMRKTFASNPGFYLKCSCQSGLTSWCQNDHHGQCHRATPLTCWEDVICDRTGDRPVYHAVPHEHPTPSITGPRREEVAQVYLADRICRWICSCEHHAARRPAAPERETVPRTYALAVLPGFEQIDLLTTGAA